MVGGGIAGMVAALHLARAGLAVDLLEAEDQLGGKLRAARVGEVQVDVGPDAFVARRPEAVDLCRDLGIAHDLVAPGVSGAAVWARGRLRALPDGLVLGVPTRLGPLARSGIVGPAGTARAAVDRFSGAPRRLLRRAGPTPVDSASSSNRTSPPRSTALPESTCRSAAITSPGGDSSAVSTTSQGTTGSTGGEDRSVGELVEPRLGHRVTRRLVDPLVGGVHAGPVAALSAEAVFPALLSASRQGGSLMRALAATAARPPAGTGTGTGPVFLTLRSGLAGLASGVRRALDEAGVTTRTGTAVRRLVPVVDDGSPRWQVVTAAGTFTVDGVVLAVPAPAAARLLGADGHDDGLAGELRADGHDDGLAGELRADGHDDGLGGDRHGHSRATWSAARRRLARALGALDYATVNVVTLAFDPEGPARRWRRAPSTGFLVPAEQGLLTTGGTWLSAKWPDIYPGGPVLVRLSAGRHGDERATQLDDAALVRRVLGELRAIAGDVDDPLDAMVTRWTHAFPQYRVGHRSWVGAVMAMAGPLPPLELAGAAYDGVGVPACIGSGRRAARLLSLRLLGDHAPVDDRPGDHSAPTSRPPLPRSPAGQTRDSQPRDDRSPDSDRQRQQR
ncbi:MAG: FAD-dependent oxidoreductase [Actinomycetota bacterium]|nr:FAD-dependent oxidoreductase [Actinomycetota bacterium]